MVLDILVPASVKFMFVLLRMTVAGPVAAVNSKSYHCKYPSILLLFVVVIVIFLFLSFYPH